ncbi:serine/threonine-protein kinase [Nocardia beijingensis]|uniref:serine/threonine-protein kinase n=1 Tax=Nocardia beijingensis TaxID=95162 RepID=UPI000831B392|nr:serine/threonine-protein kinase [Nocardia beijingensis]
MNGIAFGRYRLHELIGEGGMGQVWRAYDTATDRIVAIKLLPERCAIDPNFRERFRREAHDTAQLREPHVVPIHGYGEIEGHLYLDMRLIDGADARTLLNRDGAMRPETAVAVIAQVAAALDAAHAQSLVHRDVKPSNLLVTDSGFVYLIDFGIARSASNTPLTSTSTMIGTLAYMAPERFTSGVADARSDVYALTCVLCEFLTGIPPYPSTSTEQQIAAHLTAAPPAPSMRRLGLPVGFDDVIARGMAKNPDDRYQTAGELASAAAEALTTASAVTAASDPGTGTASIPTGLGAHSDRLATPPPLPSAGPNAEPQSTVDAGPSARPPGMHAIRSDSGGIGRNGPAPPRRKLVRAAVAVTAVLIAAALGAGIWWLTQPSKPPLAFDGKYEVTYTPRTLNGKPDNGPPKVRTWSVRSDCPSHGERCVASITSQSKSEPETAPTKFSADYRDGAWMITRELPSYSDPDCENPITKAPQNVAAWQRLEFRPGALPWTGTYLSFVGGPCAFTQQQEMKISRIGETDPKVAVIPPETLPDRADSRPVALISGAYDVTITYTATPDVPNPPPPSKFRQQYYTLCTREGDRCAATTQAEPGTDPRTDPRAAFAPMFVLENGVWRAGYSIPYPCSSSSNEPHTDARFHWELFPSDVGPDPTEFLTGSWTREKAQPCPETASATVEMRRVGSGGGRPAVAGAG